MGGGALGPLAGNCFEVSVGGGFGFGRVFMISVNHDLKIKKQCIILILYEKRLKKAINQ